LRCQPRESPGLIPRHRLLPIIVRSLFSTGGDEMEVQAGPDGIRFLLVSGKPLSEPVAWYGPIVMNTQEQLRQAFDELEEGTFLKG
jgi:redox-sensitive bicupin YhaK (pirin superfamily)